MNFGYLVLFGENPSKNITQSTLLPLGVISSTLKCLDYIIQFMFIILHFQHPEEIAKAIIM